MQKSKRGNMIIPHQDLELLLPKAKYYGPCSVDLTLGNEFTAMHENQVIDTNNASDVKYSKTTLTGKECFRLKPNQFILATTIEKVYVPETMAAYVEGRSSIGRLGLQVQNAGFIDSGFEGEITLELFNQSPNDIIIHPGMRICQIVFMRLTGRSEKPYDGKYSNQAGATESKFEGVE